MSDSQIPDLNNEYVEPLFYYNLAQGYMCPDSVDGFDNPDGIVDGDVTTPYVKIPFDQALADSHDSGINKRNREEFNTGDVGAVVEEDEDDEGFEAWLESECLGQNMTVEEEVREKKNKGSCLRVGKTISLCFVPLP